MLGHFNRGKEVGQLAMVQGAVGNEAGGAGRSAHARWRQEKSLGHILTHRASGRESEEGRRSQLHCSTNLPPHTVQLHGLHRISLLNQVRSCHSSKGGLRDKNQTLLKSRGGSTRQLTVPPPLTSPKLLLLGSPQPAALSHAQE